MPAQIRSVALVPVDFPTYENADDAYISTEPGLFPDLLLPLDGETIDMYPGQYRSLWIDFPGIEEASPGEYPVTIIITLNDEKETKRELHITLKVLPCFLPKQKLLHTQWFYADALASYYHTEPFDEEHWRIIEEFIKPMYGTYRNNTLITPVFTTSWDRPGSERPVHIQLADIYVHEGLYSFGFEKLDRWCGLCRKYGITHIEVSHFFTSWGSKTPMKILGTVDGKLKKLFGYEKPATDPEFRKFLEQFIPALRKNLEKNGYDKDHVIFHVSDEPGISHLETYRAAKEQFADLVAGSVIIDALSDFEFYKLGVLDHPVPANDHVMPFIEAKVPNLWVYYCCGQYFNVPNRFLAMPSSRNRAMGVLMYLYQIAGFLHWGYNYYYNHPGQSLENLKLLDPFFDQSGMHHVPAGDSFLVYPGQDGKPLSSIHGEVIREAIDDIRVLELVEERFGRDRAVKLLYEDFSGAMTFEHYPLDPSYYTRLREKAAGLLIKQ
ncbi:MAG: DUF4091 domain-containing protein [Treponema sp.]|nr:DUF4091 domain-containing protein [Treponema sp.]